MYKKFIFIYSIFAYIIGLVSLIYMVFWLYPWSWMPTTIDNSTSTLNPLLSVSIDIFLISLFGIQHSLMVRPSFKRWFDKYIPKPAQRATYTLISSLFLILIIIFWQNIDGYIWYFKDGILFWIITFLYLAGWSIAVIATFLIDHFELFGLHQAWRYIKGSKEPQSSFQERGFYKYIRHPIQAGTILGIWATPQMSIGHLIFSIVFTIYILIGLHFEEKDLIKTLGEDYIQYRKRVPMLIPRFFWR